MHSQQPDFRAGLPIIPEEAADLCKDLVVELRG